MNFKLLNSTLGHFYFREKKKIDFHDTSNLHTVILSHSVAPHKPSKLFKVSPATLLYQNQSASSSEVHLLYCSRSRPEHTHGRSSIVLGQDALLDALYVGVEYPQENTRN